MSSARPNVSDVWFSVTDLDVVSGSGSWVTTTDGTRYLDFSSGIAVTSTGHCHPHVVEAIQRPGRAVHPRAGQRVPPRPARSRSAARLGELTPGPIDTFFFANSGAETTEAAVKLAKQVTGRPNVIVFSGSFHGRTHLTMAMTTSKTSYRAGHMPLPAGVFVAPFPDPLAADQDAEVARALDGLRPPAGGADRARRDRGDGPRAGARRRRLHPGAGRRSSRASSSLCREHGILFVADEVQSGFGRTGAMFAVEHYGVEPDIICMAKGIASGFPFAALGRLAELDGALADRQPRRHVRRQPHRLRRRARHHRGAHRARLPRGGAGPRRPAHAPASGRSRRRTPPSCRSAVPV